MGRKSNEGKGSKILLEGKEKQYGEVVGNTIGRKKKSSRLKWLKVLLEPCVFEGEGRRGS